MPMRWKLLILLLCISVVPILVLRTMSKRASSGVAQQLAAQEEITLIKRSETELLRLVEDHANLTGRDKSLLEAMVIMQASAAETALAKAPPANAKLDWARRLPAGDINTMGRGRSQKQKIEFSPGLILVAPKADSPATDQDAAKLSGIESELKSIAERHPDLVVRQMIVLKDGLTAIMPGPLELPPRFDPTQAPWFKSALQGGSVVWGKAHLDTISGEPVMAVAKPFGSSGRDLSGAAIIVANVSTLLKKDRHATSFSPAIKSFLVRTDQNNALEVVVKEENLPRGRNRFLPQNREYLTSRDRQKLSAVAGRLLQKKSGVMELDYEGAASMWAYSPVNWQELALVMIVPRQDLIAEAAAARENVLQKIDDHVWNTSILLAIVLSAIVVIALVSSRTVTLRLKEILLAVNKLEQGDLEAEVHIRGRDEIASLGRAYNRMLPALRERLQLKESLALAKEVQTSLLPSQDLQIPGLRVSGTSKYCDETGGDFFDWIAMGDPNEPHYVLLAGDVTGHGAPAALLMTTIRAFLRAEVAREGNLAKAISAANRLLCEDTFGSGRFVTLFALEVNILERNLFWVKAGQHPGLLLNQGREDVMELSGPGLTMGVDPDYIYESNHLALQTDCIIAITTDGIPEAMGPDGAMFGMDRLKEIMHRATDSPGSLIEQAFSELELHQKGQLQEDDYTLLAAQIKL
jgi:sigma-B regulation protein RsbU (phosphoserine phosphatase)